jgi:two-component system, OmpR family, response regulator
MSNPSILVVDDDPRLREVVRYALGREGFDVREAGNGQAALDALALKPADLVVLDVMMPELDGMEVCRRLRRTSQVPVIFLTSRSEELDRVIGLELGGDDYLGKPFSPRELVSRVKAVLRRTQAPPLLAPSDEPRGDTMRLGPLKLEPGAHRAWVGEQEMELTVTEFNILRVLLTRPGRAYTRDEIVELAYPGRHFVSGRTLDSHVRRIRQKLRDCGIDPIETVHGLGYRIGAL